MTLRFSEDQYNDYLTRQRQQQKLGREDPAPPSKYGNKKVVVDGEKFDSKKECGRYQQLLMMERAGLIKDLKRQVKYELAPSVTIKGRKRPPLTYIADHVFIENGQKIVEDVKGMVTKEYRIKRHLMKAVHGIDIREV